MRRIGIIGAMDEEIALFLSHIRDVKEENKAGITYFFGTLHGHAIVLCKSGVGKVNASICTQQMIDLYSVDRIIFTGVAGGVDPQLDIGDIVVSTDCLQHDIDATALSALDIERGQIPFAETSIFQANEQLVGLALQSGQQFTDVKVTKGRVLSGDQFIANAEDVQDLRHTFQGACVEMEGAAVGHVCHANDVPFVIIRSLSDKADGSADVNFMSFTKLASERSFEMVNRMLKGLD
nr:5'-methylthioadenosine/adenosylhomocysteine nucleosidase [Caldalkalibacillus salinus]